MRILHVNKFLYRRGGAEAYMEDLAELQAASGHQVAYFGMADVRNTHLEYARYFPKHIEMEPAPSTLTGKVAGLGRMLYSTSARRGMEAVLDEFRPDVVHLHNIYHQLSPSLLRPLARRGVPTVMTLHDYKLACPSYQFLDHGNLCQACLGGHFQHAVARRCKDGSLAASAAVAVESFVHTLTKAYAPVRVFICPSEFMAGRMRAAGVFPDRLRHVPHFIDTRGMAMKSEPGGDALLAGRLSREKGVDIAIRAIGLLPGRSLDVAGTGPEEVGLRRLADAEAPGQVRFHGLVPKHEVQRMMLNAALLLAPSRWYENQPMIVLEALAMGVPVVASRLGGMPELVAPGSNGDLVAPNDPAALSAAMAPFLEDPAHGFAMRHRAREGIDTEFSPRLHLERIHALYKEAGAGAATVAA